MPGLSPFYALTKWYNLYVTHLAYKYKCIGDEKECEVLNPGYFFAIKTNFHRVYTNQIMGAAILYRSHDQWNHVTSRMDAARVVFVGADKNPSLIYETCSVPQIKDGEVLAKVLLATICGSDLHTICGNRTQSVPRCVYPR